MLELIGLASLGIMWWMAAMGVMMLVVGIVMTIGYYIMEKWNN
jgi:hypothetical protein